MTVASLRPFFEPASVAVIGASRDPSKVGGSVLANLRAAGFEGRIIPVNVNAGTVQGLPAVASLEAMPGRVDLAVITLPAPAVLEALQACELLGVGGAVLISAGFREMGGEGLARETALRAWLSGRRLRLLGPPGRQRRERVGVGQVGGGAGGLRAQHVGDRGFEHLAARRRAPGCAARFASRWDDPSYVGVGDMFISVACPGNSGSIQQLYAQYARGTRIMGLTSNYANNAPGNHSLIGAWYNQTVPARYYDWSAPYSQWHPYTPYDMMDAARVPSVGGALGATEWETTFWVARMAVSGGYTRINQQRTDSSIWLG